jgi:hypothetical protein
MTEAVTRTTAAAKTKAAAKAETNDAAASLATVRAAGETAVQAVAASGKAAFEGVIAFEKALLGYTRVAFDDTVAHLSAALEARNVAELYEGQKSFVQTRYATVTEQSRELADLTRAQLENTVAPLRELAPGLNKAA